MKTAVVRFTSISPYSQSREFAREHPRLAKETPADHEVRCWRFRLHSTEDGHVFIPPTAFKNALSTIAKYRGDQIPGKGKSTYTKYFEAGVIVVDPLILLIKVDDVKGEWLFLPADGKRGSGKRVWKCMPVIHEWSGEATFMILDETITSEVFAKHIEEMGLFVGIGRFRPQSNGFYGRFKSELVSWS